MAIEVQDKQMQGHGVPIKIGHKSYYRINTCLDIFSLKDYPVIIIFRVVLDIIVFLLNIRKLPVQQN